MKIKIKGITYTVSRGYMMTSDKPNHQMHLTVSSSLGDCVTGIVDENFSEIEVSEAKKIIKMMLPMAIV